MDRTFSLTLSTGALDILRLLTAAQQGQLLMALAAVGGGGTPPTFKNRPMAALFHILRNMILPDAPTPQPSAPRGGESEGDIEGENKGVMENNKNFNPNLLNPSLSLPSIPSGQSDKSGQTDKSENPENPQNPQNPENPEDSAPVTDADCAFDAVWRLYAKDVGDMAYLRSRWASIGMAERRDIVRYVRRYVQVRPDPKFRRNFRNFLEMRTWETEPLEQVAAATRYATEAAAKPAQPYAEQPHQPTRESILREIRRQKEENRRGEELMRKHGLGHLLDD